LPANSFTTSLSVSSLKSVLPENVNFETRTLSVGETGSAGLGSGGLGRTSSGGAGSRSGSRSRSRIWPASGRTCANAPALTSESMPTRIDPASRAP
jgi:hypothetical protein